jgi:hypothetical protein
MKLQKKYLYLALIGLLIVAIPVVLYVLRSPKSSSTGELTSGVPFQPTGPDASETKALKVYPAEDTENDSIKNPSQTIEFTLSEATSPDTVRVEVEPPLPLQITQGESADTLVISPEPPDFWAPDIQYEISVYDQVGKMITQYSISVPPFIPQDVAD